MLLGQLAQKNMAASEHQKQRESHSKGSAAWWGSCEVKMRVMGTYEQELGVIQGWRPIVWELLWTRGSRALGPAFFLTLPSRASSTETSRKKK